MFLNRVFVMTLFVAGALIFSVTAMALQQQVFADAIICSGRDPCSGTNGNDNIVGNADQNQVAGLRGDDIINGKGGPDIICAGPGNDIVNGGDGDDPFLVGDLFPGPRLCVFDTGAGADKVLGGNGDDRLFHSSAFPPGTTADGKKDLLDCGPGNDQAFINTSVDGDIAVNCETVIAG